MNPTTDIVRFAMSRTELLASDRISGATTMMFCTTATSRVMKRFDLWFTDDRVVLHATMRHGAEDAPGLIVPAELAGLVVADVIVRALGGLPMTPGSGRTSLPSVEDLLPAIVGSNDPRDRALVLGTAPTHGVRRYAAIAELGGGGLMAVDVDLDNRLRLEPAAAPAMWGAIVRLLP